MPLDTLLSPYSAPAALAAFGLAAWTAGRLPRLPSGGMSKVGDRHGALDGLRGLLAVAVFLHHASVWYGHLRQDRTWVHPPSQLYTHLGQSSVALFFMVTAFLFFGRLLDTGARPVDWLRLYVSRGLRLAPLYAVAVGLMVSVVMAVGGGVLRVPAADLAADVLRWLGFALAGMPDLNLYPGTGTVVANAYWSLAWEWKFYAALPLMAVLLSLVRCPPGRPLPPPALVAAALLAAVLGSAWHYSVHWLAFAGGIAAALAVRWGPLRGLAVQPAVGWLVLACVAAEVTAFDTVYAPGPMLLLALAFALVAAGNDVFGVLRRASVLRLGELSYGLYLLHGIVLFVTFEFVIGKPAARAMSPVAHAGLVLVLTPLVVLLAGAALRWVEQPALRQTDRVCRWLRSLTGAARHRPAL